MYHLVLENFNKKLHGGKSHKFKTISYTMIRKPTKWFKRIEYFFDSKPGCKPSQIKSVSNYFSYFSMKTCVVSTQWFTSNEYHMKTYLMSIATLDPYYWVRATAYVFQKETKQKYWSFKYEKHLIYNYKKGVTDQNPKRDCHNPYANNFTRNWRKPNMSFLQILKTTTDSTKLKHMCKEQWDSRSLQKNAQSQAKKSFFFFFFFFFFTKQISAIKSR